MMVKEIQNLIRFTDRAIANLYLSVRQERHGLLCFLFHSLFRNESEIDQNLIDPLQRTTVSQFRELIQYYQNVGYRFIGQDELLRGVDPDGKYALITFDDGYYNNRLALPVLEEFNVPALFFISTHHIRQGKNFWWDVVYRERLAQGATPEKVHCEQIELKVMQAEPQEQHLRQLFGPDAFKPRSDIDRPFTVDELRQFGAHPLVYLGNHTANHAILPNYSREQIRNTIADAQQWLTQQTTKPVVAIAYPNGAYTTDALEVSAELGLKLGFTVQQTKNRLPLSPSHLMELSRIAPHDAESMPSQCRTYRSDFLLYNMCRETYLRLAGRGVLR
jgi:peptidoglycan/xylan/chitin deacetylase (PgdA/CDA1 family)